MRMYLWVQILQSSTPAQRKRIREAVLEGMSYYNAKWDKVRSNVNDPKAPPRFKLKSKDSKVLDHVKKLKDNSLFEFIGFAPDIVYIKEKGAKEELEAKWQHLFGSTAVIYNIKGLPGYYISSAASSFNTSPAHKLNTGLEPIGGMSN